MTAITPAERILIDLGISEPKDIDLEAIAWTRGAAVNYRPMDGCEARIIGTKRKAVISVNSLSTPQRRRFSLAHELGHWHHHRGRILFCGKDEVCNFRDDALNPERQADDFASHLILPDFMVAPRVRKMKRPTLSAVRELADEFGVSDTATAVKMASLNRFPMIVICHGKTRRRWFRRSKMVQNWWFPSDTLDRESYAGHMLFDGEAEQNFPRKTPAEAWFSFKGCDRSEVEEQSFLLPNDEILTILKLPDEAVA